MKLHQEFTVASPLDTVWAYFHDIPRVAAALPGAEYFGEKDGKHTGKVTSKVGPFHASFEGEAAVVYNDAAKTVQMEGKGVDKKGASRGKMTMNCALEGEGNVTKVVVDTDLQLSGTIAQFGRTGIITEIANVLVADFVRNAEADLAASLTPAVDGHAAAQPTPAARPASKPLSATTLLMASLKAWLRGLFAKRAS